MCQRIEMNLAIVIVPYFEVPWSGCIWEWTLHSLSPPGQYSGTASPTGGVKLQLFPGTFLVQPAVCSPGWKQQQQFVKRFKRSVASAPSCPLTFPPPARFKPSCQPSINVKTTTAIDKMFHFSIKNIPLKQAFLTFFASRIFLVKWDLTPVQFAVQRLTSKGHICILCPKMVNVSFIAFWSWVKPVSCYRLAKMRILVRKSVFIK